MFFKSKELNRESGAVLLYFALLLIPLIMLVALAIDTTRLSSSHSQQRDIAGFASLAALESFVESDPGTGSDLSRFTTQFSSAVDEAEKTANHQLNKLLGRKIDAGLFGGQLYDPTGIRLDRSTEDPALTMGAIRAGNWWYREPADPTATDGSRSCTDWVAAQPGGVAMDDQCPCPGDAWDKPCFERIDPSYIATNALKYSVGAFQVTLKTQDDSPIKTVFARAAEGQATVDVSSRAQATRTPRRGVFIVDLSRSMNFETHLEYEFTSANSANPQAVDYAIRLLNDEQCDDYDDFTNNCTGQAVNNAAIPVDCQVATIQKWMWYFRPRASLPPYTQLESNRPEPPTLFPSDRHFKNDYQCLMVDVDQDGSIDESYLIDTDGALSPGGPGGTRPHQITGGGIYGGVEPLSTVLGTINRALATVEERSLEGDQIGVVFFDETTNDIRIFPSPTIGGLTAPGESSFDELKRITNIDVADGDYADDLEERLKKYIFPRTIFSLRSDGTVRGGLGANTGLANALLVASAMLSNSNIAGAADDFIAVFSDGLTNCSHDPPGGTSPDPNADHSTFTTTIGTDIAVDMSTQQCESSLGSASGTDALNRLNNHLVALQEASAIVSGEPSSSPTYSLISGAQTLQEQGVAVHMFLVGNKVQPNTAVRPNTSGDGCMSADEARGEGFVHAFGGSNPPTSGASGISFAESSYLGPSNPYFFPNTELYSNFVAPTGGKWAPIRRPCSTADWNSHFGLSGAAAIDQTECEAGDLEAALEQYCQDTFTASGQPVANAPFVAIPDVTNIVSQGALICDPRCRSTGDSTADNVEEIYNDNPYVLVEAGD